MTAISLSREAMIATDLNICGGYHMVMSRISRKSNVDIRAQYAGKLDVKGRQ